MSFKSQLEDLSRYRNSYFLAFSIAMGSVFFGYDIGLIGGVLSLDSFQRYFGLDKMDAGEKAALNGNIVAILQVGCLFGALGTGSFSSRYGRKPCLFASGAIYVVGSSLQVIVGLGTTRKTALSLLYFGRFLGGIGVGMVTALVPSYVSECTPRAIRGRCTGVIQLANNIGIMLAFWVNYIVSEHIVSSEKQWRIPFAVQIVPGVLFLLLIPWQPESPRYMVEHQQYNRAAETLAFLARTTPDDEVILATIEEIKTDFVGKVRLSVFQQIMRMKESRGIALRCFIPSLVMFFQQWTGTNAINYFSPQIFASLGINGTTADLLATGIYGVVKVISVFLVLAFAVEGIGRKKCLIIGGLGQSAMMLWIGGYSGVHASPSPDPPPLHYVSIIAIYLFAAFYSIGWGPIPWVVAGEVAPNHLRTAVMSMAISIGWLFSLTISKLTPLMLNTLEHWTFLLFGFCCFVMSFWAWLCLPETAGLQLEDIGPLFEYDVILRALQDAPGGSIFIGSKRARPVGKVASVTTIRVEDLQEATQRETETDEPGAKHIVKKPAGDVCSS
ncbi:general substrate transporter [Mycena belliarum]|uniref:General substrate transporter n=1 Tax=Mycena belliarum TaxID=1033014 RepID=A0AAD6TU93_9AGAR|nr:general substrate transporter [Mycena belliae]